MLSARLTRSGESRTLNRFPELQRHAEVRANAGNLKFSAERFKSQFAVKSDGQGPRVAPQQPRAVFPRKRDARGPERAAKTHSARLRRRGHSTQLPGGYTGLLRHFRKKKRRNADQPPCAERAKVPRGGRVIAGELRRRDRAARAKHRLTK